jgi:hypothetical protein
MCLTCGCGEPHDKHENPDNLTMDDLEAAARAAGITPEQALQNMQRTFARASHGGTPGAGGRRGTQTPSRTSRQRGRATQNPREAPGQTSPQEKGAT